MRILKSALSLVASVTVLATSVVAAPALAANQDATCDLSGSGTAGSPWLITSQADLLEIGIGDCISTYNQSQYYKLANDIGLTGNWTPIELYTSYPIVSYFDGDGHTIYGLQVSGSSNNAGLFSNLRSATVNNLNIMGTSISGGNFVGALAGNVVESTVSNVRVHMSGGVSGLQLVGGVIGKAYASSISNIAYYSEGTVSGTSYCGGAIGGAESTAVEKVFVQSDTNFSNIGGGVIGDFVLGGDKTLNNLYFDGNASADQYSGGLVGYAWSSTSSVLTIMNSAVVGSVEAKGNYEPAALIGNVGNGISGVTAQANFVKAAFRKNASSTPAVVATVKGANGISGSVTYTDVSSTNFYVTTGGSSLESWAGTAKDVTVPANLTPLWNPITQTSWSTVDVNTYRWVVDTSGATNGGLPMPAFLYNSKYFQQWCAPGRYSLDGFSNCTPATAGKFVPYYGATAAIDCPAGTFQGNAGAMECEPAPAGHYVPVATSLQPTPCPAGTYQALTGQMVCLVTSAGHYTDVSASTAELPCPVGYYQPSTNQTGCLPAQAGSYVGSTGATAQTPCPAGQLSDAAAAACFSPATSYVGPQVAAMNEPLVRGSKVRILGSRLETVTAIWIDGVKCDISNVSESGLDLLVPGDAELGQKDLELQSSFGILTVQDFASVIDAKESAASNSVQVSVRRTEGSARIFAKGLVGAGKVQFLLNGKEIAWVNAVSANDSKLRSANGDSYLVRTATLVEGQKNIIEIHVDGKRVKRVAYTR